MRPYLLVCINIWLVAFTNTSMAYETETHALITREAYGRSVLVDQRPGSIINRLGLDRLSKDTSFFVYWSPRIEYYYNGGISNLDQTPTVSFPEDFERCQMQEFLEFDPNDFRYLLFSDTVESTSASTGLFPIQNWLVRGAIREDDLGGWTPALAYKIHCGGYMLGSSWGEYTRSFNHFYDPVADIPLVPCQWGAICQKSVDWALGYVDSFANPPVEDAQRRNRYSYKDARNAYWWALTREFNKQKQPNQPYTAALRSSDAIDRMYAWATVFRSLGDVVHLLQDAGQPQHTRNDAHSAVNSGEQQAFEGYTNARVLGETGESTNSYLQDFFGKRSGDTLSAPPLGNYPSVMFATPLRFFTTRQDRVTISQRAGLADYSNRGFFTGGTKPGETLDPWPPQDIDVANGYGLVTTPCEALREADRRLKSIPCAHYTHAISDVVNPGYAQTQDVLPQGYTLPNAPILAESIFSEIVHDPDVRLPVQFSWSTINLGITELQTIGNLTIPRAIGYSTGLINYFFRGQLTLSSPPDGLYGVVDQGAAHTMQDGVPIANGTTFGFSKVRIRVKNTTGDANGALVESGTGTAVPQIMRDGKLLAVARYHRNPCYTTDLSGEYVQKPDGTLTVPSGCNVLQTRTAFAEISVSAPVILDASGNLPGAGGSSNPCANVGNINLGASGNCQNDSALLEFDFSNDPIPINATDLFLEVAYRGTLGAETDGIAVGSKDILEPNFFTVWNNTDWFLYNGQWTLPQNVPNPPGAKKAIDTSLDICYATQRIASLAAGEKLEAPEFVRLAVLTDQPAIRMGSLAILDGLPVSASDGAMPGIKRQSDKEGGGIFTSNPPAFYGRGITLGFDANLSFTTYGNYSWDLAALFNLNPMLGTTQAPGVAHPITVQYTSTPNNECASHFPNTVAPTTDQDAASHAVDALDSEVEIHQAGLDGAL